MQTRCYGYSRGAAVMEGPSATRGLAMPMITPLGKRGGSAWSEQQRVRRRALHLSCGLPFRDVHTLTYRRTPRRRRSLLSVAPVAPVALVGVGAVAYEARVALAARLNVLARLVVLLLLGSLLIACRIHGRIGLGRHVIAAVAAAVAAATLAAAALAAALAAGASAGADEGRTEAGVRGKSVRGIVAGKGFARLFFRRTALFRARDAVRGSNLPPPARREGSVRGRSRG